MCSSPVACGQSVAIFRGEVLVGALGIEPRTNGLKGRCSTIELRTQQDVVYQTSHESSCRPQPFRAEYSVSLRLYNLPAVYLG
jgi:hypothetical protein